ncbi:9871_t:CDS:2, partial [Gigaspora margarita]
EQCQKFYKEAWTGEKEKRQAMEQERNVNIIQENIEFILSGCRVKLGNSCSEATMVACTKIVCHLERLDPATIKPEVPLASGIIDLSGNEDQFVNLLSSRSKQILMHHEFSNNEFPGEIKFIVDDFVDMYKDLRPDFDPVLMRPIAFPRGEMSIESRRILMTVFDLLEGLRHIWSLRPLLTEDDYSKNSYVIHAVSKVLDPIFTYSKWSLKRAWSKQTNKSSQSRMERIEATNSGKKPDLQVLLKLDTVENEIVLTEVSQLLPQQDKEIIDWKKLVRICKDCFDERYNVFFDGRDDTTDTARSINVKLGKVPVLDLFEDDFYRVFRICELVIPLRISSRPIVKEFLKNALKMRFVVEKIIAMSVDVKDEISLLPVTEDRTPSTSMMSTTYSPPKNF